MSTAREVLDCLAEIGAIVRPAGDGRLIVRAGPNPVPAELVQRLRQAKAEVLAVLARPPEACDAAWWRDFFEERAAHLEIDAGHSRIEAEMRAFNECVAEWLCGMARYPGRLIAPGVVVNWIPKSGSFSTAACAFTSAVCTRSGAWLPTTGSPATPRSQRCAWSGSIRR